MLPPFIAMPSALAVDPLLLAVAGRPLVGSASALRQALPALDAAWLAAAEVLFAQQTGQVLAGWSPTLRSTLALCLEEAESFAAAFRSASMVYADADGAAIARLAR